MTAAETVAKAFHEAYERLAPAHGYETREASAKPWEEVPAENRSLMVAVAQELLDREQIEAGVPVAAVTDHGWRSASAAVADEEERELVQEWWDSGMGWLANRVLHPFGWALGVTVSEESVSEDGLSGKVAGLFLAKTGDPEGIVNQEPTEVAARRKFFAGLGHPLPPASAASEEDGILPTACPGCGRPRYRVRAGGDGWPPVATKHTFVEPHPYADGIVSLACGNPRCEAFEAMQRPRV